MPTEPFTRSPDAVAALHDRDRAAEHRLADAVLRAALDADVDAPDVEGAEARAADRPAVEVQVRDRLHRRRRSASSGRKMRARESAPASSVPSTRSLASTARSYSCATRPVLGHGDRAAPRAAAAAGHAVADAAPARRRRPPPAPRSRCEACLRLHADRLRDDQARRLALLLGADTGMSIGSRSSISSSGRIISREVDRRPCARACTSRSLRPTRSWARS